MAAEKNILTMHKKLLFVLLLLSASVLLKAQDPSFSQYYGNPMYLNPALTGSKVCPRLMLNYRNQWPAISGTFVTYSAAYDQYVSALSGGVGIMVMSDNMADGLVTSNSVSGMYSFRLELAKKMTLNMGFQGSYIQNKLNWDKLTFGDMLPGRPGDPLLPTSENVSDYRLTVSMVDFSSGILLGYNERAYIGVAAHHMTQPDNNFNKAAGEPGKLDMKITAHAGALFGLGNTGRAVEVEDLSISPNIMYQQQGAYHQVNVGAYLNVHPFVVGGWYRHNLENPDAVIVLLGFMANRMKIGYSYDYTVSGLTNETGGAHEISFAYQFDCTEKTFKLKAIKCPRF